MIDSLLTPDQKKVKEVGRELAKAFAKRAARHDLERSLPVENFAQLCSAGLYGAIVPKELGGMGIGMIGWTALVEELAQGCSSTALAFNMHLDATGMMLRRADVAQPIKENIARLVIKEGKLFSASASEPSLASLLPTSFVFNVEAKRVPGGYRLYGKKHFSSMFEASDYCYLFVHPAGNPNPAQTLAVAVPTKQAEIAVTDVWDTMGMRATRSNQVEYNGAFVPDDLVLYETESFIEGYLIGEAAGSFGGFCACYMGVGLGIVNWVSNYVANRNAKGYAQVMGYHPDISRRVGEMVTEIEAARLMVYRAAWEQDHHGANLETFHSFAKAKLAVGNALQRIITSAPLAGGAGSLFRSHPLERMLRDGTYASVMPPPSDASAMLVGLLSLGLDPAQAPTLRREERGPGAS